MSARRTRLLAALALAACATPGPLAGQRDTTPLPAALLVRLGEAVDGYRTGHLMWVVASPSPPYTVVGVFPTPDSAKLAAGRGYGVYGPYFAPPETPDSLVYYALDDCPSKHYPSSECDDSMHSAMLLAPRGDIDSISVTFHTRKGPLRRAYRPDHLDALFFTIAAMDKFAIPYYVRLRGVAGAAEMRSRFVRAFNEAVRTSGRRPN